VLNKLDLLAPAEAEIVRNAAARRPDAVPISALTGEGTDDLLHAVADRLDAGRQVLDVTVSLTDGRTLAWLHERGEVLERHDDEAHAHLRVSLDPVDVARLEKRLHVSA